MAPRTAAGLVSSSPAVLSTMEAALSEGQKVAYGGGGSSGGGAKYNTLEESYRPLPSLFLGFLMIWTVLTGLWTLNTWTKRQWQTSNLQWVLTAVPALKALVLGLSFIFWYSCLNLSTCSFWVAFGVFVTRIFFETACFIAFLLIAHGYCIMHEQLSVSERRSIAGLASLLYLTLTGYKAAIPQFVVYFSATLVDMQIFRFLSKWWPAVVLHIYILRGGHANLQIFVQVVARCCASCLYLKRVLVAIMYFVLLYVIFLHVSRNLALLREQLQQIQNDGVQMMHSAIYTKYSMFKKFQGSMLVIVIAEALLHTRGGNFAREYWMRLVLREWMEISIFFYIGWTFRSREATPFFTVIPTLNSPEQRVLPPIYRIEMDQKDFDKLDFREWNIGVPTCTSKGENHRPMLVIVQNPRVLSSSSERLSTKDASLAMDGIDHEDITTSKRSLGSFNLPNGKQATTISSITQCVSNHCDSTSTFSNPCGKNGIYNHQHRSNANYKIKNNKNNSNNNNNGGEAEMSSFKDRFCLRSKRDVMTPSVVRLGGFRKDFSLVSSIERGFTTTSQVPSKLNIGLQNLPSHTSYFV